MRQAALVAITLLSWSAFAGQSVTLAWNPNSESNLAGYKLYYGTASRSYPSSVAVGQTMTTVTVSNLVEGQTYFFAVTAFTDIGLESDYSDEVSYRVPTAVTNRPPVALNDLATTSSGAALAVAGSFLLANDQDPDVGDVLSIAAVSSTSVEGGTVSWNGVNATYLSRSGFVGTDSFTYTLRDAAGLTAIGRVVVTVTPAIDSTAPVVAALSVAGRDARSITLAWVTDEPARCAVEFGTNSSLGRATTWDTEFRTSHSVRLEGLQPATGHQFRVRARDQGDNESVTGLSAVTTPAVTNLAWAAEAGVLTWPMTAGFSGTALGQACVASTMAGSGAALYPIEIGVPSDYRLWCRVWAPVSGIGSFNVAVDDGAADVFDVAETDWRDAWRWVALNGRAGGAPLSINPRLFQLSAGQHRFVIGGREANIWLDELILSNDPDWIPGIEPRPPVLTALAATTNRVQLTWTDRTSDEEGFVVEWSADGSSYLHLSTVPAGITNVQHAGLLPSTTYHYRVFGFNQSDRTDYSNVASARTFDVIDPTVPPAAPVDLIVKRFARRSMELTWTDRSNSEDGFVVERSDDGLNFQPVLLLAANSISAVDQVDARGWYYYRVRAINGVGSSLPSNVALVRTP